LTDLLVHPEIGSGNFANKIPRLIDRNNFRDSRSRQMDNYLDVLLSEPVHKERSFEPAEYANRLQRVRQSMAKHKIDVLLVHSAVDLCYLTGYQTLWPDAYACLVVPLEQPPFMQLGEVEASCAVLHGDIDDLVLLDWVGADTAPQQLSALLADRGFAGARIGVQSGRLEFGNRGPVDARLMDILRETLENAQFVDVTYLMFDVRVTKSAAELAYMRKAGRITVAGMQAGIAAVAADKTENDIAAIAARVMIDAGSEFFSIDPIVNAGYRTGYFHTTFKRHPIADGDAVQLEFGGCYHRYTSPQMRTVIIGRPSDIQRRMMDNQLAALETLYAAVRAGRSTRDVVHDVDAVVGTLDQEIFRSGHNGYSVGLGFPPTWTDGPAYLSGERDLELTAGMTFHTPFSWRIPKQFVIGTSETIAVTNDGAEILTSPERSVVIK
jgi:Xaa-Pro aminopeptidase